MDGVMGSNTGLRVKQMVGADESGEVWLHLAFRAIYQEGLPMRARYIFPLKCYKHSGVLSLEPMRVAE